MAVQISGNDITVPRDGSFTRNVTIGGTLTYEDVTNIDSVGLVTARSGIEIGARPGVAASISVDGNMIVSGISTFGGDVQVPDKIVHTGDTNTAIRFPSADTITAETGGSERVRIDSSGRLLIGSTAKAGDSALQVYSSDKLHPAIRVHSTNANGFTMFGDAYQTDESNMSIGISYSSASLVISQGCKVSTSSDDAYVSSQDSYSTKPNVFRLDTDGSFSFLNTNTSATTTTDSAVSLTERVRITSDGKVGINEASPAAALDVEGSGVPIVINSSNSNTYKVQFENAGSTLGYIGAVTDSIVFSNSSAAEQARFTDAGLKLPSGRGIDFSATSGPTNGTGSSELFDDYEEGTWSPAVQQGVTNTQTFDSTARYTKIGRQVYCQFLLQFSGAGTGDRVQFSGLPFTSVNNSSRGGGTVLWTNIPGLNDFDFISVIVAGNATNIECYQNMDNNATTGSGGFTNKAFYARFTYEAA